MSTEEAAYPTDLEAIVTLPDKTAIRVRALHRCEDGPIRELFENLSLRSRYLRFLSPLASLPESLVTLLTAVDHRRTLALVALHESNRGLEVVGLASFGALDDTQAEVALVVRDDWQRRHIGTELAERVLVAAEQRGFHQFVATFFSDNAAIRGVLARVGVVMSSSVSGSLSELVFMRRTETSPSQCFAYLLSGGSVGLPV